MFPQAYDRTFWRRVALLTVLTFLAVVPSLHYRGGSTTSVYSDGTQNLTLGKSPFDLPRPAEDTYKYSPSYAVFFLPFYLLPEKVRLYTWAFFLLFTFWWGTCLWVSWNKDAWRIFLYVFCAMEVNGSVIHGQMNPLIVGITLVGIDFFRRSQWFLSALNLVAVTNFKVISGIFLLPLLFFRPRKEFWAASAISSFVVLLLPVPWYGLSGTATIYLEWFQLLQRESGTYSSTLANLQSFFIYFKAERVGLFLTRFTGFFTFFVLCLALLKNKKENFPWVSWMAFGFSGLLLFSPRTEIPTFIIVVPPAIALADELKNQGRLGWEKYAFILAAILITFFYNDLWPRFIWNPVSLVPRRIYAITGAFILWGLALRELKKRSLSA